MKVIVAGGQGQLGRALARRGALALGRSELDVTDAAAVRARLARERPEVVINAAAYTAVDRAETEADAAFAVNATGARAIAQACADAEVRLLHVSTDHVFDGRSARPYREDDPADPLGVYGASKLAGEAAVRAAGGVVVRTSWLFGAGGTGFVASIARAAIEQEVVRVVADQHGCPTFADDFAGALLALAAHRRLDPIYHYAGQPPTTRHGFAIAIVDTLRARRQIRCERVEAVATADVPRAAPRPAHAVLDTTRIHALGIEPRPWAEGLAHVIEEYAP